MFLFFKQFCLQRTREDILAAGAKICTTKASKMSYFHDILHQTCKFAIYFSNLTFWVAFQKYRKILN